MVDSKQAKELAEIEANEAAKLASFTKPAEPKKAAQTKPKPKQKTPRPPTTKSEPSPAQKVGDDAAFIAGLGTLCHILGALACFVGLALPPVFGVAFLFFGLGTLVQIRAELMRHRAERMAAR